MAKMAGLYKKRDLGKGKSKSQRNLGQWAGWVELIEPRMLAWTLWQVLGVLREPKSQQACRMLKGTTLNHLSSIYFGPDTNESQFLHSSQLILFSDRIRCRYTIIFERTTSKLYANKHTHTYIYIQTIYTNTNVCLDMDSNSKYII